jgi:hypothetical protein
MAHGATWVKWNEDAGTIESSSGRMIVLADGFVKGFVEEMIQAGGMGVGKMVINNLGRDLGIDVPHDKDFLWDDFEAMLDKGFEPFGSIEGLPSAYTWDGKGRSLLYQNAYAVKLWPVKLIGSLKSSSAKSLTERGANAIIGLSSRRGGKLIGEVTGTTYGWNTLKIIFDSLGGVLTGIFSDCGWGRLSVSADYDRLVTAFVLRNAYEIEAQGNGAQVTIVRNLIEGVADYLGEREGMKPKSREFTLENGADARVLVITFIQTGKEVDWDALEWKKMVA